MSSLVSLSSLFSPSLQLVSADGGQGKLEFTCRPEGPGHSRWRSPGLLFVSFICFSVPRNSGPSFLNFMHTDCYNNYTRYACCLWHLQLKKQSLDSLKILGQGIKFVKQILRVK